MTQENSPKAEGQSSTPTTPASSRDEAFTPTNTTRPSIWRRVCDIVFWVPPNCRWDPDNPPGFSMSLNFLFAFAGAFTVANLYYNHPILNILADDFNVTYERVAQIPTVMQAGYAAGLLFLCPMADMVKRRPFVTGLMFFTATVWIGLCVTHSLTVFSVLSFVVGATTVTPQLMLPLVGELAPPHKKGVSLSIVTSGLMLGILIARLLSGTITQYASWRSVYWMALGLQYLVSLLLWAFMPDYPSTNPTGSDTKLAYLPLLRSIPVLLFREPALLQACLISIFTSATFTVFWTTLTFLLAGAPYHLSPLSIGLFALIGIGAMLFGPLYARLITDAFVPWLAVLLGELLALAGILIGTYAGTHTLAAPVLQAFLFDLGFQSAQVANRKAIYAIAPHARNRVNTVFMVFTFCGQLMGTAVGSAVYQRHGWVASGSVSVGLVGVSLCFCAVRGPWETGWVGWGGGWALRRPKEEGGEVQQQGSGGVTGRSPGGGDDDDEEKGGEERVLEEIEVGGDRTGRAWSRDGGNGGVDDDDGIVRINAESDGEKRSTLTENSLSVQK
ncbi:mfs general substrate transporter [Diplodia corticola]|uniref:Mfs general substrate transporter n=1 Tax=Diplodia corticola TaxID=236234 RepID=A0A1J9RIN8_9PEZI|nr:mfs general substrate transporter [Diplodia corticola]OJD39890.1 mfs general substrate transporter [Diplodia corticola]